MEANRALDEAVKAAHERDRASAELFTDFMAEIPAKRIVVRAVVRLLEQAREDGAADPVLAREMAIRRVLALADDVPEPSSAELKAALARVNRVVHG